MRILKYGALTFLAILPLLAMTAGQTQTTSPPATTQPTATQAGAVDPELQKLVDDYTAAWAKGDAAAIAALYTPDAFYIDSQGKRMKGQSEITAGFNERFAGGLKGSTITIQPGETVQLGTDVQVAEGTWKITAGAGAVGTTGAAPAGVPPSTPPAGAAAAPMSGRYLNTLVRKQGRWMIAGTAAVPELMPTGPTQ